MRFKIQPDLSETIALSTAAFALMHLVAKSDLFDFKEDDMEQIVEDMDFFKEIRKEVQTRLK